MIDQLNLELHIKTSEQVIRKAYHLFGEDVVASTSFKDYSAVFLDLLKKSIPQIRVIFIDTGYLTQETLSLAERIERDLEIKVRRYFPLHYHLTPREKIPKDEEGLKKFCYESKVEPFERALRELNARALITGALDNKPGREDLEFARTRSDGIIELRPMGRWKKKLLQEYAEKSGLPINENYKDVCTGEDGRRECGIFTQSRRDTNL